MANTNQGYIDEANALLADAAVKIAAESSLADSVIALLAATKEANTALEARVNEIIANTTVDPVSVEAVRAAFKANADALDANAAKLAAAVPQNTPADPARRR